MITEKERKKIMLEVAGHFEGSNMQSQAYAGIWQYDWFLDRAGAFAGLDAPKLPTMDEIAGLFLSECVYAPYEIAYKIMCAGYATEDEPDVPDYTENDVRELANIIYDKGSGKSSVTAAQRVFAAGYRKAKP